MHTKFKFHCKQHPSNAFNVDTVSGTKIGFSQDYELSIQLNSQTQLDLQTLVAKNACLTITKNKSSAHHHGIITRIKSIGTTPDHQNFNYSITLQSPLSPLKASVSSRVFLNKTTIDIVKEILVRNGWGANTYNFYLKNDYQAHALTVQHQESDYDFLLRQLDHAGLFFCFKQSSEHASLIITDDISTLSSAFSSFTIDAKHNTIMSASEQSSHQKPYILNLSTDIPNLAPGQLLILKHSRWTHLNDTYYILSTQIEGDQSASQIYSQKKPADRPIENYTHTISLLPTTLPYIHPIQTIKQIQGIQTGFIDNPNGQEVFIDDTGQYHIRFAFDDEMHEKGQASNALRLMQHHVGQGYGFHFPLHDGSKILTICVNGDPNCPVILGVLPNPEHPSPVNANNATANILRTYGGNELCIDDNSNAPAIKLSTNNQLLNLSLESKNKHHRIGFAAQQGEILIKAQKDLTVKSGKDFLLSCGGDRYITIEHEHHTQTQQKDILLHAATDIKQTAKNDILFTAKNDIQLKSGQHTVWDVGSSAKVNAHKGDLSITANKGALTMRAQTGVSIFSKSELRLATGDTSITIKKDGSIYIKAKQIDVKGMDKNTFSSIKCDLAPQ